MFDFNKLYELAPTLSDDEEIKSHLCNIVKNLEQAVPTDEEISQLTSREVIERVSSFFNNASSKLFTDLSRQRSRDKKGYKATISLDRLSSHILDSLEQTLSQLNVEQIHMRQAKFTYLQTIILSNIFSIGNHVHVSIKDVIAFFSFVSYVSNNLEILDQLDFTPGYTHPVDIEYWMNLIPDKSGCAFDLLSDYNIPLELNSHQISEALNNACGFELFTKQDIDDLKHIIDHDDENQNLDIDEIQSIVDQYKISEDLMIDTLKSYLSLELATLEEAYDRIIKCSTQSEIIVPEIELQLDEITQEVEQQMVEETQVVTVEPLVIDDSSAEVTVEPLVNNDSINLLTVRQLSEEVLNIIGETLFAVIVNLFNRVVHIDHDTILKIQNLSVNISETNIISTQLIYLQEIAAILEEKSNLLESILGSDVTFFPNDFESEIRVINDLTVSESQSETQTDLSEPRNEWMQEWLTDNNFTFTQFTETNLPSGRKFPFVMYHITSNQGDQFIALICDQTGNSNCFINMSEMSIEEACELVLNCRRDIYYNRNVVFITNNPSGKDAFCNRLESLFNLETLFNRPRFIDEIQTYDSYEEYLITQETFNYRGLDDIVDFRSREVFLDLILHNDQPMNTLFNTLLEAQTENPQIYPFEMLLNQLNRLVSREESTNELNWNNSFTFEQMVNILSLKDFVPTFDSEIIISEMDLLNLYEDMEETYRITTKKFEERLKLALGFLFLSAYEVGDINKANYYFLKYKSFLSLLSESESIERTTLLINMMNPSLFVEPIAKNARLESIAPMHLSLDLKTINTILSLYAEKINILNQNSGRNTFKNMFFDTLYKLIDDLILKIEQEELNTNVNNHENMLRDLTHGVRSMFTTATGSMYKQLPSTFNTIPLISAVSNCETTIATTTESFFFSEMSIASSFYNGFIELQAQDALDHIQSVTVTSNKTGNRIISVGTQNRRNQVQELINLTLLGKLFEACN